MLRESSTSTAMMFCCRLSSAMVMARLPQQHQDARRQQRLQSPDDPTPPTTEEWRGLRPSRTDQPREAGGRGQDQQRQHPRTGIRPKANWPRA